MENIFGLRIKMASEDFLGKYSEFFSGVGNIIGAPACKCPNCKKRMFPAINLTFPNFIIARLGNFERRTVNILFCPTCALYMEPYWIKKSGKNFEIIGGHRDGGDILQNINDNYRCRKIEVEGFLSESAEAIKGQSAPGNFHQIGGRPRKIDSVKMPCCDCGKVMKFFGVLDYDDCNIPLYENDDSPVALIIGDYDSMNIYSCDICDVIGLAWIR